MIRRARAQQALDAWLAANDPIERDPAHAPLDPDAIWSRIVAGQHAVRPRSQRRLTIAAAAAACVLLAAGAAWWIRGDDPIDVGGRCFAHPSLAASSWAFEDPQDPVETCRRAWADPSADDVLPGPPPQLTTCTLADGSPGVFPGPPSVCERLGLRSRAPGPTAADVSGYTEALADRLLDTCTSPADAARLATSLLADHGMADWDVEVLDVPADACAAPAVDASSRTVAISAAPPHN